MYQLFFVLFLFAIVVFQYRNNELPTWLFFLIVRLKLSFQL